MIDAALIKNLTLDDLQLLDAESLNNPLCLKKLAELVEDSQLDLESGRARDFYESLNLLALQSEDLLREKPENFSKMASLLLTLLWKAMPALPVQQRKETLTSHLLAAIGNNVDVRYYLQKYLDSFELLMPPDKEERKVLSRLLESNEEILGNSLILVANKEKARPTVKNWLADYNSYAAFNNIRNVRGNYEHIKYLNNSPNIKLLTKAEQTVLLKVIELYDWLLFPSQIRTNIAFENEPLSRQAPAPVAAPAVAPPVVTKPALAPLKMNVAPIVKRPDVAPKIQGTRTNVSPPSAVPPKTPNKPPGIAPLAPPPVVNRGNVNLQDILNERMDSAKFGGVIWDNKPTNVNLGEVKKNVEQKRADTEAEIAKKLEELKKRKTT